MKSRPSTVGVPAWAKAAKKRQAQVLLLEKKKTAQQMKAELRLADKDSNESDFLTTTRVGVHRPKHTSLSQHTTRSTMASTHNQEIFVFYHPPQDYPIQHSKVVNSSDWMTVEDSKMDYKDSLSESQLAEVQSLQNQDPKLWTAEVLSHMYKVKPLSIIMAAPLSPEQQLELEVEQDFQSRLSDYEKKEYADFKEIERRKQLQKKSRRNKKT